MVWCFVMKEGFCLASWFSSIAIFINFVSVNSFGNFVFGFCFKIFCFSAFFFLFWLLRVYVCNYANLYNLKFLFLF
jgi:hypothetical protein